MKKALRGCARLSLVDKRFEISNFDFLKDMAEVLEYQYIIMNCDTDMKLKPIKRKIKGQN
jgi:hypothetical protein